MHPSSSSKKLSSLGEFGWLNRLLPKLYWPPSLNSQLCIGPGDDAGAMRITPGKVLVATTDAMVEGIHFDRKWFPWDCLGEKILTVNLSDLAAMGDVKPLAALVTAAFPGDTPVNYVDKFYRGLKGCAQRWKTGLLGGDTVGSQKGWFISITLFGEARPQDLIQRIGARSGDFIVTTGPLGQSGAGLEVLQSGTSREAWMAPLLKAFLHPEPRFAAGAILGRDRLATSLMDCSDGLEASVKILSDASGMGAEIYLEDLPVPSALERWAKKRRRSAWDYALRGGEDYELIFTASAAQWARAKRKLPQAKVVGRILPKGKGTWAVTSGGHIPLKSYGFSHFNA